MSQAVLKRRCSVAVLAAIVCLRPLAVDAVIGTEVVGIGTLPERVNITFPGGTVQSADPTTAKSPILFVPDPAQPGAVRVVFDLPVADGSVAITDTTGAPVVDLQLRAGQVVLDTDDPHSLADYLRGLDRQIKNDFTAYERYQEVWDALPESMQDAVYDIWEAQEAAEEAALDAQTEQSLAALDAEQWAENVGDVMLGADLAEPSSVVAQANAELQRSADHYRTQLGTLQQEAQRLTGLIEESKKTAERFQISLTAHLEGFSWWDNFDFTEDRRTAYLQDQLANAQTRTLFLQGQLAATGTALQNVANEAARYEAAISLNATKADAELRAQAETQRFEEAVALSQELAQKKQQFVDGYEAFQGQLTSLDNKIAMGEQHGLDSAVEQWQKDKLSVQSTYDMWHAGMQVAIEWRGWDLHQAFARNARDGIGPTDGNALRTAVIQRGLDVGILEFSAEQLAALREGGASPAAAIAAGAVGLDVQPYTWRDFAHDYSDEFYVTFGSWDKFSSRYGAFWGGVGRATKDAVHDIFVLGAEGVDTFWEAEENAINYYFGTNTNVFGGENLEFIFDFSESASKLDSKLIYETTQGVVAWADRRFERQAGSGEAGLLQGLGDAGYVVGTVAGVEEAGARLLVTGTRYGLKAVRAGRIVNQAENVASAGADAARAASVATDGSRAADAVGSAQDAARIGNATVPPPAAGAIGQPIQPGLIGARGGEVAIARNGDRVVLTHSDGYTLELGPEHKIGSGSTSDVYRHPNNENLIIKVTRPVDNAGVALDNFGYRALEGVDSNKLDVPTVHDQFPITAGEHQGGVVSVVERAPKTIKDSPELLVNGELTPGMVRAYQVGMGELIARGLVLFDTKWDNWAFRQVGTGDDWVLVGVDLGSVVPVIGRDPGVAEQVMRGLHTLERPQMSWQFGRALQMDTLASKFDGVMDWQALNAGTNGNYSTLAMQVVDDAGEVVRAAGTLPYNPYIAKQFPSLQQAFAAGTELPIGGLPAAGFATPSFRSAPTGLETGFGTFTPNYFRDAATGLETGFPTLSPNYFRDAPTALDGATFLGQPGAIVHTPFNLIRNFDAAVGNDLAPFLVRRFVIGACDFDNPETCTNSTGVNVFSFPEDRAAALGQQLQVVPGVVHFELNHDRLEQIALNDPLLTDGQWNQWAIARVGFTNGEGSAWDAASPKRTVTVAVIDTGVAWNHADLGPRQLWINRGEIPGNRIDDDTNGYVDDIVGWNFVDDNNLPWDVDGHGTVVAGIIAAQADNGIGIAGINPQARIMVLRALNEAGKSKASHVAEAITYAANNGAKVINLSVGGRGLTKTEQLAIAHAYAAGATVVVAAGNESVDTREYGPAGSSPEAIIVAATDRDDVRLAASNWGNLVDVAAPGLDVVGTRAIGTDLMLKFPDTYVAGSQIVGNDGAYYRATGTSFAAPIVAATASLIIATRPELTAEQVARMIRNSARDIADPGIDQFTGYGLLDAHAALRADPDFYLEGRIDGVRIAQRNQKAYLEVLGSLDSDALASARIELGAGDSPTDWRRVGDTGVTQGGVLAAIESSAFAGSKAWTLRLVAQHRNGAAREARFVVNVN